MSAWNQCEGVLLHVHTNRALELKASDRVISLPVDGCCMLEWLQPLQ
jgi:hypothetical protein